MCAYWICFVIYVVTATGDVAMSKYPRLRTMLIRRRRGW